MIQVHLSPDIEARVEAEAHAQGIETESFVRILIEHAVGPAAVAPLRAGVPRDMDAFFKAMAANSDKIPELPDKAFARESFYQDHD